jgi:hypothetical protein
MIQSDPEYYHSLQKELTTHGRWLSVATIGFLFCLVLAFAAGPNAGWTWLLGSLFALMFVLLKRIDQLHTHLLIQIYLANAK